MSEVVLVFPHQLFEKHPALSANSLVILVEERLFFRQYRFHKQKLRFHRASMKAYEAFLKDQNYRVRYIESTDVRSDIRELIPALGEDGIETIRYADVADDWLRSRLKWAAVESNINLSEFDTPLFMSPLNEIGVLFKSNKNKRYRQTDFYIEQRKRYGVLVEEDGSPIGGKWSYDAENRSKYPQGKTPPEIVFPDENEICAEAERYVQDYFAENYGRLTNGIRYPITHAESREWLQGFLANRFAEFGDYQDAIVRDEPFLHHSLLSPMLNTGLITPVEVIETTLRYAEDHDIPLNTPEGFIRQILGWREFLRGVYELEGRRERTCNFWGFDRKIPESFWDGSTGIEPVDTVIQRVLDTGYCHHIERLMILGNFMLLCEFDPDEVYRWFMELFIDAYDWVMVPNVYGMSQYADGGLVASKPYISSSNYVLKMSDFDRGDWCEIWDALFWRFMHVHRDFFEGNARMRMLVRNLDRMEDEKRNHLLETAESFLSAL